MTQEAAHIAGRLSEAQRRYLFKLPRPMYLCDARSTPGLWAKGLLDDGWSTKFGAMTIRLTALGEQVKAILQAKNSK